MKAKPEQPNLFPSELSEQAPGEKPPVSHRSDRWPGGLYPKDLYRGAPPSVPVETSEQAITGAQATKKALIVLMALRDTHRRSHDNLTGTGNNRSGATCDELERITGLRHQTCSARLRELELTEHVYKTEVKRRTSAGRPAFVYEPTEKGWAV